VRTDGRTDTQTSGEDAGAHRRMVNIRSVGGCYTSTFTTYKKSITKCGYKAYEGEIVLVYNTLNASYIVERYIRMQCSTVTDHLVSYASVISP